MADEKKPLKFMDMREAEKECSTRQQQVGIPCPACGHKIIIHCSSCQLQVTMCLCSTIAIFGEDEAFKRIVEQYGEEQAREQYRRAGLFVPKAPGLIIPD